MTREDRDLEQPIGVDLHAWEAPPPADGFADGVIARMHAASATVEPTHTSTRRWWLAGGAAVLVAGAAAATLLLGGVTHAPPAPGALVAARAQHLDLDTISADLESGADLAWHRDGGGLVVEQHRGNASWRVGGDDQLTIDTGAAGALVNASGASLRVEVHMQLSDARVVGASSLTAAAVAFVTVVVYEGHVNVRSAGQTVNVAPGASVEVRPGEPPAPPPVVGDDVHQRIEELQRRIDQVERDRAGGSGAPRVRPLPPSPPAPLPDGLDRAAILEGLTPARDRLTACGEQEHASGTFKLHFSVEPSGSFTMSMEDFPASSLQACLTKALDGVRFRASKHGASFTYPIALAGSTPEVGATPFDSRTGKPTACDAEALDSRWRDAEGNGAHAQALTTAEAAIACKPTDARVTHAFMSACNVPLAAKARDYYQRLSASARASLVQLCVRNGIRPEQLDATTATTGHLSIHSRPAARVLVDGKDTSLTTPVDAAALELEAGKHKVTLVIGDDRYTFPVTVEAGKTTLLEKDLQ